MRPTHDLTDLRFGRLVALQRVGSNSSGAALWEAKCDCGKIVTSTCSKIRTGHTKSCGCLKRDLMSFRTHIHGDSNGSHGGQYYNLYARWSKMRGRVLLPANPMFYRYGGRGIKICEEWSDYTTFRDWSLSNGYRKDLTLDRIDNDGDYSPNNCRWTDVITQSRNKSNNLVICVDGITAPLVSHTERLGVPYDLALKRIRQLGWTPDAALKTPKLSYRGNKSEQSARKSVA